MTKTELDWTFDDIPDEAESAAASPALSAAARPTRRAWLAGRAPRWLLAALLAVAVGGAAGAYAFQRVGWARLEAQVRHEVVTEDDYARAGDVAMVRSFLAEDDQAWAALRAAEARQGLAVTLPAGHMRPLPEPPQVAAVEVLEGQIFQAEVLRAFTDPSGQVYHLRYTQRYRNLGPGLWERLPTDLAALALQGRWTGERLVAVFPMTDWPWMEPVLPRLDAWLVQACADWACPDHATVALTFTGQPGDLRPRRGVATTLQPGPASMPIVFALNQQRPLFPARLVLPALYVAGYPVEPAAEEALVRAVATQALLHLAQQVAGLSQDGPDYYLEALVARAETRLGLSPMLRYQPLPDDYVPPPGLWSRGLGGRGVDLPPVLDYRLQALAFLDHALAGQPARVDGLLLHALRGQAGLMPWLGGALGPGAPQALSTWTARVTAASAPGLPLAWPRLDGLAYTCDDGAWLIRDRALNPLWSSNDPLAAASGLSPDGRYLATLRVYGTNGRGRLRVVAVDTAVPQPVAEARFVAVLGWSADNALLYLQNETSRPGVRLMRYEPVRGTSQMVVDYAVRPVGLMSAVSQSANWSPDRTSVALTLNTAPGRWQAAVVGVAGEALGEITPLAAGSGVPILAPDEDLAVYEQQTQGGPQLVMHDLDSGETRRLVTALDVQEALPEGVEQPERLIPVQWSPDGEVLLFTASSDANSSFLFVVNRAGAGPRFISGVTEAGWIAPLGFAPDGRYLGYFEATMEAGVALQVLPLEGGPAQALRVAPGSVAWSAEGHLLALADEAGAYVLDPATGERRWLAFQTCQRVSW